MRVSSSVRAGEGVLSLAVTITVTQHHAEILPSLIFLWLVHCSWIFPFPSLHVVLWEGRVGATLSGCSRNVKKVVLPVWWSSRLELVLGIADEIEGKSCRVGRVLPNCAVPQHVSSLSSLGCCGFMQKPLIVLHGVFILSREFSVWCVSWSDIY